MNILESWSREETVAFIVKRLGIEPHLTGYDYICCAVNMCIDDTTLLHNVVKGLYVEVAKVFGTTGPRVERSIRHSIDKAINKPNCYNAQYAVFGDALEEGSVTNTQFIATIVKVCKNEPHNKIFIA